jgi:hypothetical protein
MKRTAIDDDFVATNSTKYRADLAKPWTHGALRDALSEPEVEDAIATCQTAWDFENHLFGSVHKRVHAAGYFTKGALLLVGYWKSPRVVGCLAMNRDVVRRTTDALREKKPWEALHSLHGVGVPVASALLAVWEPDTYTVIDFRALKRHSLSATGRTLTLQDDRRSGGKSTTSTIATSARD